MQYGTFHTIKSVDESYSYFLPGSINSTLVDIGRFLKLSEEIVQLLGKLDAMVQFLPDKELFIYMYVRKEALLSSQIEGTESSLHDIFAHENQLPLKDGSLQDVEEVSSYIKALNYSTQILQSGDLPFSIRLLKMTHKVLMANSRGMNKQPGEIRTTQNWIGGSRPGNANYVPPAPQHVLDLLSDMEKFYHSSAIPTPILCGMMHAHFETIHPFLDGNGRLGRLMIPLILCDQGILSEPVLYISYYLKLHRPEYYKHLQDLRQQNAWNEWMQFFLNAMKKSAEDSYINCCKIHKLLIEDERRIKELARADNILRLFKYMKKCLLFIFHRHQKFWNYRHILLKGLWKY